MHVKDTAATDLVLTELPNRQCAWLPPSTATAWLTGRSWLNPTTSGTGSPTGVARRLRHDHPTHNEDAAAGMLVEAEKLLGIAGPRYAVRVNGHMYRLMTHPDNQPAAAAAIFAEMVFMIRHWLSENPEAAAEMSERGTHGPFRHINAAFRFDDCVGSHAKYFRG